MLLTTDFNLNVFSNQSKNVKERLNIMTLI